MSSIRSDTKTKEVLPNIRLLKTSLITNLRLFPPKHNVYLRLTTRLRRWNAVASLPQGAAALALGYTVVPFQGASSSKAPAGVEAPHHLTSSPQRRRGIRLGLVDGYNSI